MRTKVTLPTKKALLDAMALAQHSSEGADYLAWRFAEITSKAKLGLQARELNQLMHDFAKHVHHQLNTGSRAWEGLQRDGSRFKVMHASMADDVALFFEKSVSEQTQKPEIQLNYAISENGAFVRGVELLDQAINERAAEETRDMNSRASGG